jgi:hypothetical protein
MSIPPTHNSNNDINSVVTPCLHSNFVSTVTSFSKLYNLTNNMNDHLQFYTDIDCNAKQLVTKFEMNRSVERDRDFIFDST